MAQPTQSSTEGLAEANVWEFDGSTRKAGCNHLVLVEADATLCGVPVNPNGYPTGDTFDLTAGYSCKRCIRALRRTGPIALVSWNSYSTPKYVSRLEVAP